MLALAQPPVAAAADTVCAGTASHGLVCLSGGKIAQYDRKSGHLPADRVADLAVCGGKIHIASGSAIVPFDGAAFGPPIRLERGFASRVSCDGKGTIWASWSSGAGRWNGSAWQIFEAKTLASEGAAASIADIAAGPNGTAWATLFGGIVAHFDGQAWKTYRQGDGFQEKHVFTRLHVDRQGRVWLPHIRGLYTFRDGKWENIPGRPGIGAVSEDAKGGLWIAAGTRVVNFADGKWSEIGIEHSATAVTADAEGNLYAHTEFGLARYSGGKWEFRQMHNSDLPDNSFTGIAVLGKGSPLPPAGEKPKGSLAGRVEWTDGKAIAEADIVICGVSPGLLSIGGKAPCEGRPLFAQAKSDGEGRYGFKDVPAANYRIAIKPSGNARWIIILAAGDRLRVLPGENKNSGTLTLDAKNRP